MSAALAPYVADWTALRAELREVYSLADDDLVLDDTLDGLSDLGDQVCALLRQAGENEAFATALDGMIADMRARKERLCRAARAIRQAVADAAMEAGIKRLTRPDMTVTFGLTRPGLAGEADPATLPDDLVRIKREPDRTAIKAALESGRDVEGFRLSNGRPSVTVRRT